MSLSTLLVLLGNLSFVVVCGTVGARLTLKATRTRQLPEFLIGIGLVLLVLAVPLLGASGMGRVTVGELKLPWVASGLGLFALSVMLQSAFVWRTFRPNQTWALVLTVGLSTAGLWVVSRILIAILSSRAEMPAADATHSAVLWLRLPFVAVYAWTAIEGLKHFRMAQRRESIGIGDPVLTNRFLLWSCAGALACANSIVSTTLHAFHMSPFNHPLGAASLGVGASLASVALILVFIPPDRYTEWIRAHRSLDLN